MEVVLPRGHGRIVDVAYQPPFDVLFRASEFEYGDLVESGLHNANRAALVAALPFGV